MIYNIKDKRLNSLTPLILAILLACLIYYFNIRTSEVKIRKLKMSIKNKEDDIKTVSQLASKPQVEESIENRLFKEKLGLDNIIPADMKLTKFLRDLEVVIDDDQINLANLSPQDSIIEDDYVKAPINLLFSADYPQLITFLSQLEEMDRLVTIEKLSISKDKGRSLKVKTILYIYSARE